MWDAPGRDKKTLGTFFDALGDERCAAIRLVSAGGAEWIQQKTQFLRVAFQFPFPRRGRVDCGFRPLSGLVDAPCPGGRHDRL